MHEQVVEAGIEAALAQARDMALNEPSLMLGQVLNNDGRVHATFAPGSDAFKYAT